MQFKFTLNEVKLSFLYPQLAMRQTSKRDNSQQKGIYQSEAQWSGRRDRLTQGERKTKDRVYAAYMDIAARDM